MGIKDANKIRWHGKGLHLKDIHAIYKSYLNGRKDSCRIDIDLNFLIHKIARGKTHFESVNIVASFLKAVDVNSTYKKYKFTSNIVLKQSHIRAASQRIGTPMFATCPCTYY